MCYVYACLTYEMSAVDEKCNTLVQRLLMDEAFPDIISLSTFIHFYDTNTIQTLCNNNSGSRLIT